MSTPQEHKQPALTTDVVLFTYADNELRVLLIQRKNPPFQAQWAIPGGFLDYGELPETGALRELQEETGITDVVIEQVGTFGDPLRDPRGHTVSVVYMGFVEADREATGADDAAEARWFNVLVLPKLAFDHDMVLASVVTHLNKKFRDGADMLGLLPNELTVGDVKMLYYSVLKFLDQYNYSSQQPSE